MEIIKLTLIVKKYRKKNSIYFSFSAFDAEIFPVKLRGHWTPHLRAMHTSNEAVTLQLHPVGFVELGTWTNNSGDVSYRVTVDITG